MFVKWQHIGLHAGCIERMVSTAEAPTTTACLVYCCRRASPWREER